MSPLGVSTETGGPAYENPLLAPVEEVSTVRVDVSRLSSDEVDSDGLLKPGVPFAQSGLLIGQESSSPGSATADPQNTGGINFSNVAGKPGAPEEVIVIEVVSTAAGGGDTLRVYGTQSGHIGEATLGANGSPNSFTSSVIDFDAEEGATEVAAGDRFYFDVDGSPAVYGVTFEPIEIADGNTSSDLNAASDQDVAVALIGAVNRAVLEDNLDRALTVDEVAALERAPIVLVE